MRALIIDAQELFRVSLKDILRSSDKFKDVLESRNLEEAREMADLVDEIELVIMFPASFDRGIRESVEKVADFLPQAKQLVFHQGVGDPIQSDLPGEPVFLSRNASVKQLLSALGIKEKELQEPEPAPRRLPRSLRTVTELSPLERLSKRQSEILDMVSEGLPNKVIAARLGIAEGTVKAHIHAIFKALGVSNRTQAVVRYGHEFNR